MAPAIGSKPPALGQNRRVSKYDPLWHHVGTQQESSLTMTFDEIKAILGFDIDHSFLNYKKELLTSGWQVDKISLKNRTVIFTHLPPGA